MQGIKRRLVYIGLYEFVAIILSAILLAWMSSAGASHSLGIAVAVSAVAMVWNLVFNYSFEAWERRRQHSGRSFGVRVLHALGFEVGLMVFLVPLLAWWFGISLLQALVMDMGLLVFFFFYTFAFNWGFDVVFGLPGGSMSAPNAGRAEIESCL